MEQQITLLDKAINCDEIIRKLKSDEMIDELTLTQCAYFAQQSIEFTLKYILNVLRISYKRTHNLGELIILVQMKLPIFCEDLKEYSARITSWEAESRYDINFRVTINQIENAQRIFGELLNEIEYSLHYYKGEDWQFCYDFIKSTGVKYEEDIVNGMLNVYHASNIKKPLTVNIYKSIRENLNNYFKTELATDLNLDTSKKNR